LSQSEGPAGSRSIKSEERRRTRGKPSETLRKGRMRKKIPCRRAETEMQLAQKRKMHPEAQGLKETVGKNAGESLQNGPADIIQTKKKKLKINPKDLPTRQ